MQLDGTGMPLAATTHRYPGTACSAGQLQKIFIDYLSKFVYPYLATGDE
jgi:hypothetical protein